MDTLLDPPIQNEEPLVAPIAAPLTDPAPDPVTPPEIIDPPSPAPAESSPVTAPEPAPEPPPLPAVDTPPPEVISAPLEPSPSPLPPPEPMPVEPIQAVTTPDPVIVETPTPPSTAQPPPEPTPIVEAPAAVPVPGAIPAAVLALSDAELRIAATYYLQKHQAEISHKGVQARKLKMQQNLDAIMAYATAHSAKNAASGIKIARLASALNLSPGTTAHYLQILVKQGKLSAEGWGTTRLYRLRPD